MALILIECIKDGKTYSDGETWEDTTSCKKFTCIAGSPSVTFKGILNHIILIKIVIYMIKMRKVDH
jgi:hypothetical protein